MTLIGNYCSHFPAGSADDGAFHGASELRSHSETATESERRNPAVIFDFICV